MLIPGPSCTGNHQSYFPVLGSPLEGALLGRAVWEPVCGSQVLQRLEWAEDVFLASSLKTWNTFFHGKNIMQRESIFVMYVKALCKPLRTM